MKFLEYSAKKTREAPPPSLPPPPFSWGAKIKKKKILVFVTKKTPKKNLVWFWQKPNPQKNIFPKPESALKPRHTARILGGQNPKKKNVLSILEKIHPREKQKSKEHFFFLGLPSEARRWQGFRGAYDFGQSHHALSACDTLPILKIGSDLVK